MIEINARKNVVSLTGIRGVAALYVVIHHFIGTGGFPNVWQTFLTHGYVSVDLFFVLSGFVMALTYQSMFLNDFSKATYFKFMQRRVARIYPIYFITTVAALVLILMGVKAGITANTSSHAVWAFKFFLNCLLIQGWGITGSINGVTWSLSAEWAAYVLFPLLLVPCLFGRPISAWAILCLSIIVIAILCYSSFPRRSSAQALLDITSYHYGLTVIRCLPEFCLGLLSFRVSSTAFGRYLRESPIVSPVICVGIFLLLLVPKTDFFIVLLFPPLIISLASGSKHIPGRLLSSPLADLLGKLSYSVYVIHPLCGVILTLVEKKVSSLGFHHGHAIGAIVALCVALILAYLSYKYIEAPGRQFFRNLFEGKRPVRLEQSVP